ncbi:MAG: DUF2189 domain-containing protein [Hyphomicrobiales bacterium]
MAEAPDLSTTPGAIPETTVRKADPKIRDIHISDVGDALAGGLRDFQRAPVYGLFFGGIFAIGGMAIVLTAFNLGMGYLAYPMAAGFALIGPFVAAGLYEVSRRLENNEPLSWGRVLSVVYAQRGTELGWMAFVTVFMLIVWMYQVRLLLAVLLGFQSFTSMTEFLDVLVSTPEGLLFLVLGNVIGLIVSLVLFSLTVISFPLLLDRDVDFITAMITSVRAVTANPVSMLSWAAIVFMWLIIGSLPFFLGHFMVLPVLGHATWHLYRKVVEPVDA